MSEWEAQFTCNKKDSYMSNKQDHFKVVLPSMGEGVIEATVNKWLKSVGEKIEKDEPLLEVSTDKVDTEITSPYSGYLINTFIKERHTSPTVLHKVRKPQIIKQRKK